MAEVASTGPPSAAPPAAAASTSAAGMAQGQNGLASYPPPQARYEEVVASAGLFMETLARLHSAMGTKFKSVALPCPRDRTHDDDDLIMPCHRFIKSFSRYLIMWHLNPWDRACDQLINWPIQLYLGAYNWGKALDLHRLFVEVTSHGGLEKAIRDRAWRDIIAMFKFPRTITSASYVLRKYYISLLHHYEQVYFFQSKSFDPLLDASQPAGASVGSQSQVARTTSQMKGTKRSPQGYPLPDGCMVTGQITGKFDQGYMVTANFGSEKFVGVLYHVPFGHPDQNTSYHNAGQRRQKKFRKARKDPSRPKSNRSGYNFFFAEQYARLKPMHSGEESAIVKQIGYLWNNLAAAEKEVYQAKGARDKERYMSETLEYKRSSNASQAE